MPSNPLAGLPASTALGATLLGLSAGLLVVNVAGTMVLDADRRGTVMQSVTSITPSPQVPAVTPAGRQDDHSISQLATIAPVVPRAMVVRATAAHVSERRAPMQLRSRPAARSVSAMHVTPVSVTALLVNHAASRSVSPIHATQTARASQTARATQSASSRIVYVAPPILPPPANAASMSSFQAKGRLADLREVRHLVMHELAAQDRRACVISAMTYPIAQQQVVVDLIFRDKRGRWSEKAVVARRAGEVKIVGVKQRLFPYNKAVASVEPPSGP